MDETFMARALVLASKGKGNTSPNPMVGAVIVKSGQIVSEGFHKLAGTDHAEVAALKKAGGNARGATLYVNLEPCCHHGLTGPCTEAIVKAGIRRVVFATTDPDKRVCGKGAAALTRAGIDVSSGILASRAKELNEPYFHFNRTGHPLITLKLAQTIDGCIATQSGDSQWISGLEARSYVHSLRAEADAVLIGAETARRDNPRLTVRHVKGRNPFRIIATASGVLKRNLRVIVNNSDMRTIIACPPLKMTAMSRALKGCNVVLWEVASKSGKLDVADLISKAGLFGFRHILVEGGQRMATDLMSQGLIDRYIAIVSPTCIGDGIHAIGSMGIMAVNKAVRGTIVSSTMMGRDVVIEMRFRGKKEW